MAIRKSKINIDTEERSGFDNMMNDVENEVAEQQAEDGLVNRVPELKQLSEDIDKATNTFINATLELESAIQQYQRAEAKLGGAVTTISKKVDTINQHIDKVLENAPTKLKVAVNVNDADWQKMQQMFDEHNKQILVKMQSHLKEVHAMFANERKKVNERYKEYDGVYLGRYAQWFFGFFFVIGFFGFCGIIAVVIAQHYGK
jgi:DNA repair exonuclease SbcCD ATPase subunit